MRVDLLDTTVVGYGCRYDGVEEVRSDTEVAVGGEDGEGLNVEALFGGGARIGKGERFEAALDAGDDFWFWV